MADFEMICPHCHGEIVVDDDWEGLVVECPECQQSFTVKGTKFLFVCPECGTMTELPTSLQGQKYACKACCEESIAEPATEKPCPYCGNKIKLHAQICKFCKNPLNGLSAAPALPSIAPDEQPLLQPIATVQKAGDVFALQSGEFLLSKGRLQRFIFPAGTTYVRLTNQRLVFSHISRWLTATSWLFCFILAPKKISLSFTKSDIKSIDLGRKFLRKTITIIPQEGETLVFALNGSSDRCMNDIMRWWQQQ